MRSRFTHSRTVRALSVIGQALLVIISVAAMYYGCGIVLILLSP